MKKARFMLAILLAVLLFTAGVLAVGAQQAEPDQTGSIRVTLKTGKGTPRPDAALSAILVAVPDESAALGYTTAPAFADSGFTVTEKIPDEAAAALDAFAAANAITGRTATTDADGTALFDEMPDGMYLIRETGDPGAYTRMTPFLVLMPQIEGSRRTFDVVAEPKPVDVRPPVSITLHAEKQIAVGNGAPPENVRFSFILTPEDITNPMPKNDEGVSNTETGSLTVTRTGAGAVVFGEIGFKSEDLGKTFTYTVRELKGTDAYFTYDTTVYTVRVTVAQDADGKLKADVAYAKGDEKADAALFVNTYDKPDDPPPVPRTGQLWWPVGLLAGGGVLLLIGGFVLRRREEETA